MKKEMIRIGIKVLESEFFIAKDEHGVFTVYEIQERASKNTFKWYYYSRSPWVHGFERGKKYRARLAEDLSKVSDTNLKLLKKRLQKLLSFIIKIENSQKYRKKFPFIPDINPANFLIDYYGTISLIDTNSPLINIEEYVEKIEHDIRKELFHQWVFDVENAIKYDMIEQIDEQLNRKKERKAA